MPARAPNLRPLPRLALTPRRWLTFAAHGFKAAAYQHHGELAPALRRLIAEDAVVFDVGAHSGQFATLFARLARRGMVYSFEPGLYARMILTLALAINRASNVRVFPVALGDKPGAAAMRMPLKRSGSFGFGLANMGDGRDEARPQISESIDVATLDGICAAIGIARLDFIKADIEGWEMRMLMGGRATLQRFRPNLLLEMVDGQLSRAGDTLAALWQLLSDLDYMPLAARDDGQFAALNQHTEGDIVWVPRERAPLLLGSAIGNANESRPRETISA